MSRNITIQQNVQRLVASLVADTGPTTRPDLAARTGLTTMAIGSHVKQLLEDGLLVEAGTQPSRGGRPANQVKLNRTRNATLGIGVADGRLHVGVVDFDDRILCREDLPMDNGVGPTTFLRVLEERIDNVLQSKACRSVRIRQVAVSLAASLDTETGQIIRSTHFPELGGLHLCEHLRERLRLPVETVYDGHAMYCGVRGKGLSKDVNQAMLQWGVGLDWTQSSREELDFFNTFPGAYSLTHVRVEQPGRLCVCGRRGCLEAEVGLRGVRSRLAQHDDRFAEISIDQLVDLARNGDDAVKQELKRTAEYLGDKLHWIVQVGHPEVIWLANHTGLADSLVCEAMHRSLSRHLHDDYRARLQIRAIDDQNQCLMLGVSKLARYLFLDPSLIYRLRVKMEMSDANGRPHTEESCAVAATVSSG